MHLEPRAWTLARWWGEERGESDASPRWEIDSGFLETGVPLSYLAEKPEQPESSPVAIEIRGLVRDYGPNRALAGLDLKVSAGEVYGLLGNNGAGKTTTLHILLGLLAPGAGEVRVLGLDPQRERERVALQVGFCPETDRPYDWLTVGEYWRFGRLVFADWDDAWAAHLCRIFALPLDKPFSKLSKGMVAKAKLVFALAHHPRLLVLDEPTSGLDPSSRQEILGLVSQLAAEGKTTTLFSSHHLDEVEKVATRIGILDAGRLMLEISKDHLGKLPILSFARPPAPPPPGVEVFRRVHPGGEEWLVRDLEDPRLAPVLVEAAAQGNRLNLRLASLPEIFMIVTSSVPTAVEAKS